MAQLLCLVFSTGAFSKPLLRVRESQRKDLIPYRAVQAPKTNKTGALWHCQCPIQSACLASRWAGSIASTGKSEYLSSGTKAGVLSCQNQTSHLRIALSKPFGGGRVQARALPACQPVPGLSLPSKILIASSFSWLSIVHQY